MNESTYGHTNSAELVNAAEERRKAPRWKRLLITGLGMYLLSVLGTGIYAAGHP